MRQVVIWIRDSDGVTLHGKSSRYCWRLGCILLRVPAIPLRAGYNGNASPFPNKTDADGRRRDGRVAQYMPSMFRVQRSKNVRLANLMDAGRVTDPENPSTFVAAGNGTDPRTVSTLALLC